jgi:transposase-like protein
VTSSRARDALAGSMNVTDEANKLRLEIVRLGTAHGRRYPRGMKELILAFIERAKDAGMSVNECCRRLGVSSKQLSNWRAASRAAQTKALVAVQVADEREGEATDALAFVTPNGFRVEGVTVAQAIELMRALA